MSRRSLRFAAVLPVLAMSAPLAAQGELEAQSGEPPERIDILVEPESFVGPLEDCSRDQEAAIISGEIVVCRRRSDEDNRLYENEEAERRHAEKTMHRDDPQAPDLFGIPNHGTVVARGCFIGPCPPPAAYLIDFNDLPDTPPGSDADRVGRGLAPRGHSAQNDGSVTVSEEAGQQADAEELGLPEPFSPSESASPGAEPSG